MKDYDLSEVRVLLVDDSRSFLSLLTDVLHGFGIRDIVRTSDAIQAFEIIRREALDIALVDYQMPLINGIEFANMVRTAPDSRNKFLSMILITGHCSRSVVMQSIKAGFDDFLAKPIRPAHLLQKLLQLRERPKDYVLTPTGYFGPDRRRRVDPQFGAQDRRDGDHSIVVGPRDLNVIEKVQRLAEMGNKEELQKLWNEHFKDLTAHCTFDAFAEDAVQASKNDVRKKRSGPIAGAVKMVSADS